jgi:hypothetical protein
MKLSDIQISPSEQDIATGSVILVTRFAFEIFGPFGQGFNIRVSGSGRVALLQYQWREGPSASVELEGNRYEMTEDSILDSSGTTIAKLRVDELTTKEKDSLLLALFAVYHHYAKRTGPFSRRF